MCYLYKIYQRNLLLKGIWRLELWSYTGNAQTVLAIYNILYNQK